ncbi:excalibur calcium-binding domain-containing protein [Nocardia xishanensis]|uniref:excalibur calcium-binding domain-containing protein n=1 Tax=Nocardia xishanensis TaxID=238964 RepID=UPI003431F7BF
MGKPRHSAVVIAIGLALLVTAGCGGDTGNDRPEPTTTARATTATTTPSTTTVTTTPPPTTLGAPTTAETTPAPFVPQPPVLPTTPQVAVPTPQAARPPAPPAPPEPQQSSVYYRNCAAAKAAGAAPLHRGEPGYRSELDRDGDGIACER